MLVLTRKPGESIHIGENIVVKVSEISGNRVKLCIDAPQILRILRGEIAAEIEQQSQLRENDQATSRVGRRQHSGSSTKISAIAK